MFSTSVLALEKGETEITTEDGIEVFQNERLNLYHRSGLEYALPRTMGLGL